MWGATTSSKGWESTLKISIHAPRVGRDTGRAARRPATEDFNPRAPCGARHAVTVTMSPLLVFQSTRPVWGATIVRCRKAHTLDTFQSTRPVWGATTRRPPQDAGDRHFNPRAPCGARPRAGSGAKPLPDFNPRAPCGARLTDRPVVFARGENFNPRAPCGARPSMRSGRPAQTRFQSTRPVWGATRNCKPDILIYFRFQSTRPVWGATSRQPCATRLLPYFNPRAPCGARPRRSLRSVACPQFQSTRPVWGATTFPRQNARTYRDFNPRAPCGARPRSHGKMHALIAISIHAPRVGRDLHGHRRRRAGLCISIHAPRVGRDLFSSSFVRSTFGFQSTRPVWGATNMVADSGGMPEFQSTRPVWGATLPKERHEEILGFQSTRPVWGATRLVRWFL